MIAKDFVTDGFIVTHSMRQISTLAHIDAVTSIKLVPSSPSASDVNDWRMALHQGIGERRQVLREVHRLQCTELLQKLRDRCRKRVDRPGEREIQELMGKRVKQDAPDYRASRKPAKKHPDNLSGRPSRAKWSCWLKRVLGDEVDRCLHQAWVQTRNGMEQMTNRETNTVTALREIMLFIEKPKGRSRMMSNTALIMLPSSSPGLLHVTFEYESVRCTPQKYIAIHMLHKTPFNCV